MKYTIKRAAVDTANVDFNERLEHSHPILWQLLREGYEPFAITPMPYTGNERVWLRKKETDED